MKILLLDDHALFRAGLRLLLKTLNPNLLTLEAGTIEDALIIADSHPDLNLCLLDINLHKENGLNALIQLKTIAADLVVVVVSASEESTVIRECIDIGAMSFISKSASPEMLSEALKHVLAGEISRPWQVTDDQMPAKNQKIALSPRQRDVLRGLCQGLSNKSIARDLTLSEYTIKDYISTIFQILDVSNRTEAVIKAGRMRLLSE